MSFLSKVTIALLVFLLSLLLAGCVNPKETEPKCVRAAINPALTNHDDSDKEYIEEIAIKALVAANFGVRGRQFFLSGYTCFVQLEWVDDFNLTLAFYLPESTKQREIPESAQNLVRLELENLVIDKDTIEVREEIRTVD